MNSDVENLALVLNYYHLRVGNGVYKIVCPFHSDVMPSLLINMEKGNWYCFGCGLFGGALEFVIKMEKKFNNSNELKSLILFHKIINNTKSKSNIKFISSHSAKTVDWRESLDIAEDYFYCLPEVDWEDYRLSDEQKIARAYLTNRGFSTKTLNAINCKFNYNKNYKLILPMMDNGEFKGWVCRTTAPEIEKKRKYLYNKGFSRSSTLVGEYGPKATGKNYVFLVEGFLDRLKLVQYGFFNSVAILGWKLSANQIQKLKNAKVDYIINCLDNDEAGKKGYEYAKNFFINYRISYPKKIKDIGDTDKRLFLQMLEKTKKKYKIKL